LTRLAVEAARLLAVHSDGLARDLTETYPDAAIRRIRMGVRPVSPVSLARRDDDGPVFACYGKITPEKRISQVLRAFSSLRQASRAARLLLVGEVTGYYDVEQEARRLDLLDRVTITGFVPDEELDRWLMAADVCLCLRWPTARETSASWLRCLAAGKPTVVTDLAHTTDIPVLDPRTWALAHTGRDAAGSRLDRHDAVAVAIDILDEDHSLGLALVRLAGDTALREQLGRSARAWWARHHTIETMAADYRVALAEAIERPVPSHPIAWPPHVLQDGSALAHRILEEFGVTLDILRPLDEGRQRSVGSRC
jgi:glycosyltransferase involved in cell wall biosynthesis